MTKSFKKLSSHLRQKTVNTLMINGKKRTCEKIALQSAKFLQKLTNKNFKKLFQMSIINSTPTFKINEQVIKKGKRKAIKNIPTFIINDLFRTSNSLKLVKQVVQSKKTSSFFYQKLAKELLASVSLKSQSVDRKTELQREILIHRKYLSKFRW